MNIDICNTKKKGIIIYNNNTNLIRKKNQDNLYTVKWLYFLYQALLLLLPRPSRDHPERYRWMPVTLPLYCLCNTYAFPMHLGPISYHTSPYIYYVYIP